MNHAEDNAVLCDITHTEKTVAHMIGRVDAMK